MATDWEERLSGLVLPALLHGLHVYTGFGDLIPGRGIPLGNSGSLGAKEASTRKPTGLPVWQVYLGAKDTQPAIRFLQLVHKVRNPRGTGPLVYPTRLQRDGDRGVALILPLGEGVETPPYELTLARDLEALILHKPVNVIALGRFRPFTTTSPWSICEHILMEVYSEGGDLIWTNPIIGMSLEEALMKLEANEDFCQQASPPASRLSPSSTEIRSAPDCAQIVLERALDAERGGDAALGLILRTLALRMTRPDGS